jgi:hypothetical protein
MSAASERASERAKQGVCFSSSKSGVGERFFLLNLRLRFWLFFSTADRWAGRLRGYTMFM